MADSVIQPSFAAGEMSPSTYGRVDLAKYHSGAALVRNFYVDYRGGLSTRTGSSFVGQCKDSATANRLIPFTFSTVQTYALVFGNFSMRVVKNGAYVTEPSKQIQNISQASPGVFFSVAHGYATGDLVFFSGFVVGSMTQMNGRFATIVFIDANNYSLLDMYGAAISTASYNAFSFLSGTANAARVFTLVTPYAAADLALLKYSQSADTMTLNHPSYPEQQLTRTQHWVWSIAPSIFTPVTLIPSGVGATPSTAGATVYQYVVTAVSSNGVSESLPSAIASSASVQMSITVGAKNTVSWNGHPGDTLYNIYRTPENPGGSPAAGALYGYVGSAVPASVNTFIDNNILPDFTNAPPQANNPFAINAIQSVPITAGGIGWTAATLSVTDPTGTGAVLLASLSAGAIVGVIVVSGGQNYTAPVVSVTGTGSSATFGTPVLSPANYPAVATYYQQRQVRGGMAAQPQGLVFSKTGDFKNLTYSTPARANDEVAVTLASQTVNPIKHLVPLTSLIVLTGSGAWRVDGGSQSDAITPDHINAVPQAYNGCSDVPPIVINYDILYVQAKGSTVRDLSYNFYVNVYTGEDVSMLSNHLFFGHQITEWCWAEEPFKIVWAVRDDGIMLALTFLKEQQIYGWTRHDTLGLYKSVCSISEGNENAVYLIALRFVNGQYLQYIERYASRNMGGDTAIGIPADITKAWCVDCGLQYPLAFPASTLTPTETTNVPVISAVSIVTGGTGYTAPIVSVSDTTGSGATFSAVVVGGVIVAINVLTQGANYTNPHLTITDAVGTGALANAVVTMPVPMNANPGIFTSLDVGKVVRINNGFGTVASVPSSTQIIVNITQPLTSIWPAVAGTWSMTMPVSAVSGLDHLNGQTVSILADGNVQPQQLVTDGSVSLQTAASAIVIGLPYVCQIKTLNLDVQGGETIQGKRKKLNAVTVRVQDSRGLKVGPNFNSLQSIKERTTEKMGQAIALQTTDERVIIDPAWTVQGQLCIQQDQPLPATVLALIPEINVGDT